MWVGGSQEREDLLGKRRPNQARGRVGCLVRLMPSYVFQRRKDRIDKDDEGEGEEDGGYSIGVGDLGHALEDGEEEEVEVGHFAVGSRWVGGLGGGGGWNELL